MASSPSDPRGFREAAKDAFESGAEYARLRGELLKLEAREAGDKLKGISICAAAGLFFVTVGYALGVYFGIRAAADAWFGGEWRVVLAAVAGAHLFLGALLMLAARARAKRAELFQSSLEQFERDRQWLNDLQAEIKRKR